MYCSLRPSCSTSLWAHQTATERASGPVTSGYQKVGTGGFGFPCVGSASVPMEPCAMPPFAIVLPATGLKWFIGAASFLQPGLQN